MHPHSLGRQGRVEKEEQGLHRTRPDGVYSPIITVAPALPLPAHAYPGDSVTCRFRQRGGSEKSANKVGAAFRTEGTGDYFPEYAADQPISDCDYSTSEHAQHSSRKDREGLPVWCRLITRRRRA